MYLLGLCYSLGTEPAKPITKALVVKSHGISVTVPSRTKPVQLRHELYSTGYWVIQVFFPDRGMETTKKKQDCARIQPIREL